MRTFSHSRLHNLLVGVFETLQPRLLSIANAPSAQEVDGVEAVAMLTVLNDFAAFYCAPDRERASILEPAASAGTPTAAAAAADAQATTYFYTTMIFDELRTALETRIQTFTSEQVSWIQAQKGDPKIAGIFAPFARFPTLVMHLLEMTRHQRPAVVEECLSRIAKELMSWLATTANASDKYADKVRIANLSFFLHALSGAAQTSALESFVQYATQQMRDSVVRYLHWMVEYEFPSLSALAGRIEGVSSKVSDDELSLYIRRKDVLSVVKELEARTVDAMIASLRKRLEKHFKCDVDAELHLVDSLWLQLRERVVTILHKLETAATVSYQIVLEVGPRQVAQAFDKQQLGPSSLSDRPAPRAH